MSSEPDPVPIAPSEHSAAARLLNRELSLLAFHERVVALASEPDIPLLERLRFLCISCTNLDEFFEVRVARVKQAMELGADDGGGGLSNQKLLEAIHWRASELVERQYRVYGDQLVPELARENILLLPRSSWNDDLRNYLRDHFHSNILPVLSPIGLDPARPFPHIINKSLNFIIGIKGEDALGRSSRFAVLQAPRSLPRLIKLPAELGRGEDTFVFLASLIRAFAADVFPGMKVVACHQFRVTRNSDLFLEGEDFDDLLQALRGRLDERAHAAAVRMEVSERCAQDYVDFLRAHFGLNQRDCYRVDGPVNLNRVAAIYDLVERPDLKYPRFVPGIPTDPEASIFPQLNATDVLLHHPFDSFAPILRFLREAARDPQVLAIKQTLYRTGPDSSVVDALVEAAGNGKEVTVVIELRARFDEAENISLARRLQEAGAHVVYGVVGFKTHAKLILVVRREDDGLYRYAHVGTGNYHPQTAKAYTDYGLLTADQAICEDVHAVFLQLTGLSQEPKLHSLLQAPFDLHSSLLRMIDYETRQAKKNKPARIVAKVNSLVEPRIIEALYSASEAGVRIDLIVRGMCCLRPQVPGMSENIQVRSVLGRFLEHTRVYWFHAGGKNKVYCSSADWMDRNFFRRVEVAFPVSNEKLRKRVIDELGLYLKDNTGAWLLDGEGHYERLTNQPGKRRRNAQEQLMERLGS